MASPHAPAVRRERKLPSRRKRPPRGRAIKLSRYLYDALDAERGGRSWDAFFRRMFGLPDQNGNAQPLVEGILERMSGRFLPRADETDWEDLERQAYEIGFLLLAQQLKQNGKRTRYVEKPLRMRELP